MREACLVCTVVLCGQVPERPNSGAGGRVWKGVLPFPQTAPQPDCGSVFLLILLFWAVMIGAASCRCALHSWIQPHRVSYCSLSGGAGGLEVSGPEQGEMRRHHSLVASTLSPCHCSLEAAISYFAKVSM